MYISHIEHSTVHNSSDSKSAKSQQFSKPDKVYSAKPLNAKEENVKKHPDLCEYI